VHQQHCLIADRASEEQLEQGGSSMIIMRQRRWALTTVACLVGAASAQAQESTTFLEEIVVTAQKRVEKLQDVPISVTVVNEEQLNNQNIYSIEDLARISPSLEMVQAFGGPGGGGQIRGIGTQSFTRSAEGAVGIVVDGVPQGNVNISNIFDTARVEVLRGPQGTLFGLTSSAGVINMVTVAPDPEAFETKVRLEYSDAGTAGSSFGQQTARGVVNIPLSDTQALRVSGTIERIEGIQHNNFKNEDNVDRDRSVRARYRFNPSEDFDVNLILDYGKNKRNYSDPQFTYVYANPGLTAALAACGITPSFENNARCGNKLNESTSENLGGSAQFDIGLGDVTLTSITGYRKVDSGPNANDIKGLHVEVPQIFSFGGTREARQFSQELRIASTGTRTFDYIAGLFYSDYLDEAKAEPGGGFRVRVPGGPPLFYNDVVNSRTFTETSNVSYAAFGQATFNVTDAFAIITGLRFTHQEIEDQSTGNLNDAVPIPTFGDVEEDDVSGRFGLQYKFSPELTSYITYTRGYKGPQVSPAAEGSPPRIIAPEKPTAYELGLKGALLGGQLGFDASLFFTDVKDFQGQRCSINPAGVLACTGETIPSTKTKGVELALYGEPLERLTLSGGFIYNIAEYPSTWTGYDPNNLLGGTTDLGEEQLVGVPKTKFSLAGDYSVPLGAVEGFFAADTVYRSEIRMGPTADSRFIYPSYWDVGARIGVRSANDVWSVALFGRNLTDEPVPITMFGGPSFTPPNPAVPNGRVNGVSGWVAASSLRQVGVSVDVKF
jgi:iron complex outermembrane receptor protein